MTQYQRFGYYAYYALGVLIFALLIISAIFDNFFTFISLETISLLASSGFLITSFRFDPRLRYWSLLVFSSNIAIICLVTVLSLFAISPEERQIHIFNLDFLALIALIAAGLIGMIFSTHGLLRLSKRA